MSRTTRRKRPKIKLGYLEYKQYKDGRVREGTPQHIDPSCENHGGCPWCNSNRQFKIKRREPIEESD